MNVNDIMKWEYKRISTCFADLNDLGNQGWELCDIETVTNFGRYYIFKRPKAKVNKCEKEKV